MKNDNTPLPLETVLKMMPAPEGVDAEQWKENLFRARRLGGCDWAYWMAGDHGNLFSEALDDLLRRHAAALMRVAYLEDKLGDAMRELDRRNCMGQ